ncbi:uncharacterized protein CIMG_13022 [Coccidioides immitis RS]|uniref:Uncharacterized protein n=1 Tax=Coccidioides immitis (strain RS) TaxID=246410 RepID=A0A0D8JTP4_COCIM|nr:uncharacterized protein CIMG_13022 [Coccidioides immitis RS]KJF60519.1 hypothetical protein CIMG_13022 [Coccidioides immitis RS]
MQDCQHQITQKLINTEKEILDKTVAPPIPNFSLTILQAKLYQLPTRKPRDCTRQKTNSSNAGSLSLYMCYAVSKDTDPVAYGREASLEKGISRQLPRSVSSIMTSYFTR